MYNRKSSQENKKLFIKDYYKENSYLDAKATIFKKVASSEEKYQKDLCLMSVEQLDEMLREQQFASLSYLETCVSVMRKYCGFCMNDINSSIKTYFNHFESDLFSRKNLKKYIISDESEKYISRDMLEQYCHILAGYDNGDITSGLLRCLFLGMKAADIFNLTKKDIDFNNKRIHISKSRVISDVEEETLELLQRIYKQTQMADGKGNVNIFSPFSDGIFKCKPYAVEKQGIDITFDVFYTFLYNLMKRSKDSIAALVGNSKITPDSVYISGFIYYVKKCCERDGRSFQMLTDEKHIKMNMCETLCKYGMEYGYIREKEVNLKTGAKLRDILKRAGNLYP